MSAAVLEMSARRSAAERLADFARVTTDDVDEAAEQIGRIFCPHDLEAGTAARTSGFSARHNCAAFDGFSINYVAYGGSVSIDPGCLERFFLVQVPLTGTARIRAGASELEAAPGRTASLLSPTIPTRMMWSDCAQAILLLDRRMVEQRAAALSGRAAGAVEFDPSDRPGRAGRAGLCGRSLAELMMLAERLGPSGRLSPVAMADWREVLLDHLLNGQRHGLSDAIQDVLGAGRASAARAARRAGLSCGQCRRAARPRAARLRVRHRHPRAPARLPPPLRRVDLADAARHAPRRSPRPARASLARRLHHRDRLRSRLHPSRPHGRRLSRKIRRDAVGDAAATG